MRKISKYAACILVVIVLLSFHKRTADFSEFNKTNPASSYSPDVLDRWMGIQIKLMSSTVANFNGPFVRIYAYSGLVAYESVFPGIEQNSSNLILETAFNKLPVMPKTEPGKKYHWPSSMNAALAFITRAMFPYTSPDNKSAIDTLESELKLKYTRETDIITVERSENFGRQVAQTIFAWTETDGYKQANDPYILPTGPGKWVPTPPNFIKPSTPYWGSLRTIVTGSIENTQPPPPPAYSEDTGSVFYKMIKEVFDTDRQITEQQKDIVYFWRDINPGVTAAGHWLNVLRQVYQKEKGNTRLDKAAFAFALTGVALNDAWISCWKTRYEYNLLRPVTYIRNVMSFSQWLPLLSTPPHPEYTAGFAAMAGAVCEGLTFVFGDNYNITDHTYDNIGMAPRTYQSFYEMAKEAGYSKFYGGIHYKLSVDAGLAQGKAVAKNIQKISVQNMKTARP